MTELIDSVYFKELCEKDPAEICRTSICSYNRDERCYQITVINEDYRIYPENSEIVRLSDGFSVINEFTGLMIIYYLLYAQDILITREWISEKDIPGGTLFFTGPHEIPTNLITERFGNKLKEFKKRCEDLGGSRQDMANAAYSFRILPRIPVSVLYYMGDDEFPTEAKILFDRTISEHLTLDIIFCMVVVVCRVLGEM